METVVAYFKIHTFAWNRHISQDGWRRAESLSGDARSVRHLYVGSSARLFYLFIVTRIVNWHRWNETQRTRGAGFPIFGMLNIAFIHYVCAFGYSENRKKLRAG